MSNLKINTTPTLQQLSTKVRTLEYEYLTIFVREQILKTSMLSGVRKFETDKSGILTKASQLEIAYISQFLTEKIQSDFKGLTLSEIAKAWENGVCGRYGDYNFSLPPATYIFFLDSYKKEMEREYEALAFKKRIEEQREEKENALLIAEAKNKAFIEVHKNQLRKIISQLEKDAVSLKGEEKLCLGIGKEELNDSEYRIVSVFLKILGELEQFQICDNHKSWIEKKVVKFSENLTIDIDLLPKIKGKKQYDIIVLERSNRVQRFKDRLTLEVMLYSYLCKKLKVKNIPFAMHS